MSRKKPNRGEKNVSFEEKELEILRDAVDLVEKRKGEKVIQDPKVQKIISIVEKLIADKKLVCYGGTAINNIILKTHSFIIKMSSFPTMIFILIMRLTMRNNSRIFIIRQDTRM